ncbi:efflux RND transporter permease subunit [Salisaeta longa]|uniref:efflux RND transporter permease subunit n=1 Tax=Salisaeta longa TaxID=503170 RepID=UPI0003B54693|nr:MMPL family transporter [Salisaeta longa]
MDRLFQSLRPLIRAVVRHAGWVVLAALLLTAASYQFGARHLRINTDLAELLPDSYPSVQALDTLRATVGGESDVAVGISSPSFQANKQFAEDLIPQALALKGPDGRPFLTRVEYTRNVDFLKDNALYFASYQELNETEQYLRDQIEQAKLEANPFYFSVEEDDASADSTGEALLQSYERLVGTRYPVSEDSTTMVLRLYPSGSQTNIGYIDRLYTALDSLIAQMEPSSYHPQMEVTTAGRMLRQMVEVRTIINDVTGTFGLGALAVLLFVVSYFLYKSYTARVGRTWTASVLLRELFRAPIMALVIAVPLLMSLLWAGGVAYALFETLNLMTSTLGLVLFGLGIDFGIHFYGRYTEERAEGAPVTDAAETTFVATGQAIVTGGLTTAAALFVLTFADFKGFSQFGAVASAGILFALVTMTLVMPALLALFERTGLLNLETEAVRAVHKNTTTRFPAARPVVVGSLLAVVAALVLLPRLGFQYDFGALEPTYTAYEKRSAPIDRAFKDDGKRNPAYIVADSAAAVPEIVEAVREKMRADTTSPTILSVESLQERFPISDAAQARKLARIDSIRALLNSKYLQGEEGEAIRKLRRAAQTQAPIALNQLPAFLRKQFTTKQGTVGTFVMIYPSVGLSDGRKSIAFAKDVGTITTDAGATYHAASTSIVAANMLMLLQDEAPWMVAAAFGLVALLMLLNFRSWKWAGLALVPLVIGLLWMTLAMEVFGLMLNFYNMIVLPAVLGIGNDAGVHLVHRYHEEGWGSIRAVIRSTGEHVTMSSLTTMMGFGGLILSFHPGLRSIGLLAVTGIGATLLAAVLFLPALLQWLEDRGASPHAPPTENASEAAARAA